MSMSCECWRGLCEWLRLPRCLATWCSHVRDERQSYMVLEAEQWGVESQGGYIERVKNDPGPVAWARTAE